MPIINYIGKNLKTYSVSAHFHDYWELIYCTGGDGLIGFENDKTLQYAEGQMVIIPPGIVHSNNSVTGFKNIHMTVAGWVPPFKGATVIDDNEQKDILYVLNMCHRFFSSVEKRGAVVRSLTELLLNLTVAVVGKSPVSHNVAMAENRIIENFSDTAFTPDDAFADVALTKDYARRLFIKEKGISPLCYLTEMRLAFAEKLLAAESSGDANIAQIAEMSGFRDPLYFSRVFKKKHGVSPKKYRR